MKYQVILADPPWETTVADTNNVLATVVSMVKEEVAEEYGFKEALIVDTKWDYAMILHHRTKKQIEMYERLCYKLANYSLRKHL